MKKIVIIGGGIIGFASAVKIVEHFQEEILKNTIEVTLISNEFSPNTTGDGSAGLWGPYLCGLTSEDLIK